MALYEFRWWEFCIQCIESLLIPFPCLSTATFLNYYHSDERNAKWLKWTFMGCLINKYCRLNTPWNADILNTCGDINKLNTPWDVDILNTSWNADILNTSWDINILNTSWDINISNTP